MVPDHAKDRRTSGDRRPRHTAFFSNGKPRVRHKARAGLSRLSLVLAPALASQPWRDRSARRNHLKHWSHTGRRPDVAADLSGSCSPTDLWRNLFTPFALAVQLR